MNSRICLVCLLVGLVMFSSPLQAREPNRLSGWEKLRGWKSLFDGQTAAHFRGYKKEAMPSGWVVKDGALTRESGGGDIITRDQYESFILDVEWRISPGGNSGIMFKVKETNGASYETGPEAQVQDNVGGHDPQKAGWMYALYPASIDTTKPAGEWNRFVLKCKKTKAGTYRCTHWMNGAKYCEYEIGSDDWKARVAKSKFGKMPGFATAAAGHICLQDHGNLVSYRNIKIRPLK